MIDQIIKISATVNPIWTNGLIKCLYHINAYVLVISIIKDKIKSYKL